MKRRWDKVICIPIARKVLRLKILNFLGDSDFILKSLPKYDILLLVLRRRLFNSFLYLLTGNLEDVYF